MPTEKFVDIAFRGDSLTVVSQARAICNTYARQGYDLSLRQLYYQFISKDVFPNTEQSYKRLGDIISNARLAGLIDWDMITDRGRSTESNNHWQSPADILDAVARQFMYDTWEGQPNHVELMVEKQALEGVLEPVCRSLDIAFTANKGYSSSSAMYEAGKRLQRKFVGGGTYQEYINERDDAWYYQCCDLYTEADNYEDEYEVQRLAGSDKQADWDKAAQMIESATRPYMKPHPDGGKALHVIYLGDHDPSGIDMTRDVKERLEQFSRCPVNVHRIALNMDQVRAYNPPPNPAKITDSRADDYIKRFGPTSWELDALNPDTLANLVRRIVESLRDPDIHAAAQERQAEARAALSQMAIGYRMEHEQNGDGDGDEGDEDE